MEITRRKFVQLGLLQAGASVIPMQTIGARTEARMSYRRQGPSILQGATDESSTQFSIVHNKDANYQFTVLNESGSQLSADHLVQHVHTSQGAAVTKAYYSGLSLGQTYTFNVLDLNSGAVVDSRQFRTLDLKSPRLRFAICSCMLDELHHPAIWQDLAAQRPDVIFFIGDSTYVDKGGGSDWGADRLWRRFAEARATLEIYFSQQLIPIIATWDDHDFGANDVGKEYPLATESAANFKRFFAQDQSFGRLLASGPGVSQRILVGHQQFLLMDSRTFRISGFSNERYAHWGQEQEEWLLSWVSQHAGTTWVLNGSQIFPQMPFKESFSGQHPVQLEGLRQALAKTAGRVIFASGDVHYSEISKIEPAVFGYTTYELTSSSMHSRVWPGVPSWIPNHRRIVGTGEHNYLLVDSEDDGSRCLFRVESRSAHGRVNFRMDLSV